MRQADTKPDCEARDESPEIPLGRRVPVLSERDRAKAYLDLWERHVIAAAVRGRGVSAPWFAR